MKTLSHETTSENGLCFASRYATKELILEQFFDEIFSCSQSQSMSVLAHKTQRFTELHPVNSFILVECL